MATWRNDWDCASPQRKRARVLCEPTPTSSCPITVQPRWQLPTTTVSESPPYDSGCDSSSRSVSSCEHSPRPSTPIARVTSAAPVAPPPLQMPYGLSFVPQPVVVPQAPGVAATAAAAWSLPDFADPLAFDQSLSGLGDFGAGYVSEMMEFVKRQSCGPNQTLNDAENSFQNVLMAPTAAAVKIQDEPLTYLNQGQSYEIKCKKLGAEGLIPGRLFKTIVRITFHDRRQKFHERELMEQWKRMHAGVKLTDVDLPMSYNVFNVRTDPSGNTIEFLWDPTKSTSICVKMNGISTEFTARKHGGEKGVPFRLQLDTYAYNGVDETMSNGEQKRLHSSYAQVKVFKTKGADRKNKTDREKAEKRADKEKYHAAYDYSILTEIYPTDVDDYEQDQQQHMDTTSADEGAHSPLSSKSGGASPPHCMPPGVVPPTACNHAAPPRSIVHQQQGVICGPKHVDNQQQPQPPNSNGGGRSSLCSSDSGTCIHANGVNSPSAMSDHGAETPEALPADATPNETCQWLRRQRFGPYLNMFNSFSGADFLRLSREDLIQICGTADGIRLYNALQFKKVQPKITLFMCMPGAPAYNAIFLATLTLQELVRKMCDLIQVDASHIFDVYCQGPDGINVHMNDEVVLHMPDRSRYLIDAMKCGEEQSERYRILLKATTD